LEESNATDPEAASTQEILERWECHKRTCDNNGQHCWVNEKRIHYPLSADDAALWWGSIKLDVTKRLDKEKPPATMRKRWEEARVKSERKKRRQQKDEAIPFGPPPPASYKYPALSLRVRSPTKSPPHLHQPLNHQIHLANFKNWAGD